MAANAQARLKDDWKTSQSEAISSAKTVLRRGLWQPQGLREITLSFASEKDFTVDLLHPLPRLQQLQSLTLEKQGGRAAHHHGPGSAARQYAQQAQHEGLPAVRCQRH